MFSQSVMSDSLQPHEVRHNRLASFTISRSILKPMSIESGCSQPSHPLSSPSPVALSLSQHQGLFPVSQLFPSGGQSIGASTSTPILLMNIRGWFPYDWLVWSPGCPQDSQESSLASQFKSISSLVLSLLYGPTLTSIRYYWKNDTFDSTDLCQQSDISAFTNMDLLTFC